MSTALTIHIARNRKMGDCYYCTNLREAYSARDSKFRRCSEWYAEQPVSYAGLTSRSTRPTKRLRSVGVWPARIESVRLVD